MMALVKRFNPNTHATINGIEMTFMKRAQVKFHTPVEIKIKGDPDGGNAMPPSATDATDGGDT